MYQTLHKVWTNQTWLMFIFKWRFCTWRSHLESVSYRTPVTWSQSTSQSQKDSVWYIRVGVKFDWQDFYLKCDSSNNWHQFVACLWSAMLETSVSKWTAVGRWINTVITMPSTLDFAKNMYKLLKESDQLANFRLVDCEFGDFGCDSGDYLLK